MFSLQKFTNMRSTKALRDYFAVTESQPTPATLPWRKGLLSELTINNFFWAGVIGSGMAEFTLVQFLTLILYFTLVKGAEDSVFYQLLSQLISLNTLNYSASLSQIVNIP